MKKIALATVAIVAMALPSANAATKPIAASVGSIFTPAVAAENFVQSGKVSVFYSNTVGKNADISLTAIDITGTQLWTRIIDSGADEAVTAATVDSSGNIWLVGASAELLPVETPTSIAGLDNPDAVSLDGISPLRSDMNQLTLWKITPAGEVAATFTHPEKSLPLPSAISVNSSGISIAGQLDGKPMMISVSTTGVFGKEIHLGTSKTIINAVVRSSDGSTSLFGSSTETLGGKKLAAIRDGVLIKVSKVGAITTVVRSSAVKASRGWTSADSALLLSGYVSTSGKVEAAITQFTSTFAPKWTARYPSTGVPLAISGGGNSYLAFTSTIAIAGVTGWKGSTPGLVVLTFDSKGVMKAATTFPGLITAINLQYSRERGLIGLASASDGSISIFTPVSR